MVRSQHHDAHRAGPHRAGAGRPRGVAPDEPCPHLLAARPPRGGPGRLRGTGGVDITLDDGGTGSLWWATKNEWLGLLDVAGLRLEALYGGFAREPLDDESGEYVFVARR